MKGGLVVMLEALKAFEQHPKAENLGWEVLITSDEEIGSKGSAPLLDAAAERCTLGLVFEPFCGVAHSYVSARVCVVVSSRIHLPLNTWLSIAGHGILNA